MRKRTYTQVKSRTPPAQVTMPRPDMATPRAGVSAQFFNAVRNSSDIISPVKGRDYSGFLSCAHSLMDMAQRLDQSAQGHVSFESMERLLKVLTPNRWRLLRTLRNGGATSVRALARSLNRDYRGAHARLRAKSRKAIWRAI